MLAAAACTQAIISGDEDLLVSDPFGAASGSFALQISLRGLRRAGGTAGTRSVILSSHFEISGTYGRR